MLEWLFESSLPVLTAFSVAVGLVCIATGIACKTEITGICAGAAVTALGAFALSPSHTRSIAALAVVCGAEYVFTVAWVALKKRRRTKRQAAEAQRKRLQYTLPDRDNSYVRARLNTVLQVENDRGEELSQGAFRFAHARKLLATLKEKPLSTAERLQAQDMEKLFAAYLQKDKLKAEEVRLLCDAFAALLKLSAKYAV